jgi:DNA-binding CsgD family transcriptional regulator
MTTDRRDEHRPETNRLVLGIVGADGQLLDISANADALLGLGFDPGGTRIYDWVHPEDAPLLTAALAPIPVFGPHRTPGLRIRDRAGAWVRVHSSVSPMLAQNPPRYAVAIRLPDTRVEPADERASRLEGHLWRIALEVQAAELGGGRGLREEWWADPSLVGLSERQTEILRRIVRGERVPDIARELVITASTVRNHLSGIYRKFGVHSQSELMLRLMPRDADDDQSGPA